MYQGVDRRMLAEVDRNSLDPREARDMRRPTVDDAKHWIDVYLQLLALHQRVIPSAPAEATPALKQEAERIGRRIDYWKGVTAARNGLVTG
jgi:hypothetical protein